MAEELELPRIQPKGTEKIVAWKDKYSGVRTTGPESLRHFRRTFRQAMRRQISMGTYDAKNPVIVPIIVREDVSLRLSYLEDPSVLVISTFGVPEPIGSEIPAKPMDVDTIILPMLGFDRRGGRLGYGAGYYDRFLAQNPRIRRIGIAFACQEADEIPCDVNDIHMNLIITENGIVYSDGTG